MPTPGDEQKKYKFTTKNGQFFEELKVQSRTKMKQPKMATMLENIAQKKFPDIIPKEYLYSKSKP